MRLKLFLLVLLTALLPSFAQTSNVVGVVLNGSTGSPIGGASVTLRGAGKSATSTFSGNFALATPAGGSDYLIVSCDGFESTGIDVNLTPGTVNLGDIRLNPVNYETDFFGDDDDIIYDEAMLEDEEGNAQGIAALTGANDNIFYNTASYNFGPMYYRFRGLQNEYQNVYINGIDMNDPIRGNFNFNGLLGMTSRAFRNKTTTVGMDAASYGFGGLAGSTGYNTITDTYAPGFNGSLAYTNSNYYLRGMVTYASGLNKHGWAYTLSAIGRYSNEGIVEGTFYHSGGLFLSIEKQLTKTHSLTLSAWGGPTERANSSATYQEVYDLVGNNLYNPNWGWYQGKKRAARIVNSFDPTAMLTWLYKGDKTNVTTSIATRWVNYSQSALQYYKANDPNPTYYRYLPSYYEDDPEQFQLYYDLWTTKDPNFTQINWDNLYMVNHLNNIQNQNLPESEKKGASYILENRISNQFNFMYSTYLNHRINNQMSLQGGASLNYTKASFYKTVRDLLGGEFWVDIDPFSDRDITIAPGNLVNNYNYPDPYNHRVYKGDKFGYYYNFYYLKAGAWLQNTINTNHWDINYGVQVSYTQYFRNGQMRNGRAPQTSYGHSRTLRFDNYNIKAGATYKLDGRNFFIAHAQYGTRAPLADQVFIAPRVKNDIVQNVESERDFSADLSYQWNYRRFRGSLTAYYVDMNNVIERTGFYDDRYSTYAIYVLQGVRKVNKGLELGMAYKITPSLTATFAGTWSRYQYKNNPNGTRSFENGLFADTTQTVYLKNFYAGSVPQTVCNLGLDYAAPHNWFFNINGTWQGDAYVNLSPAYHEALPELWEKIPNCTEEKLQAWIQELSVQDKLKNAFSLNLSIGKAIYLKKVSLNFNLNINNILNNRNVVTYAYQQGRLDTNNYDRTTYPNRYTYAQGVRVFFNAGIRF